MPAKAGTQASIDTENDAEKCCSCCKTLASSPNLRMFDWVPAFAGMTKESGNARSCHDARNTRKTPALHGVCSPDQLSTGQQWHKAREDSCERDDSSDPMTSDAPSPRECHGRMGASPDIATPAAIVGPHLRLHLHHFARLKRAE